MLIAFGPSLDIRKNAFRYIPNTVSLLLYRYRNTPVKERTGSAFNYKFGEKKLSGRDLLRA